MSKPLILILTFSTFVLPALGQISSPPSKAKLAEITERGQQLAEYDVAAWYATDAVQALSPKAGNIARYIAMKTNAGWKVAFGRLNEKRDQFQIAFEATQGANPREFKVKQFEPPLAATDFYLQAAKAIETAIADFKGESRPYNVAVLPAANRMYVYVVPAQTQQGVFPLGGDARYLVSQDGSKIFEKRRLHISIIEYTSPPNIQETAAGFHTAVLDDIPEDTDVFHVLSRKPSIPEFIGTKKYIYRIEVDGTINYLMTIEAFKKIK